MINVALIEEINGLTKKLINELKEEIENSTNDKLDEKIVNTFPNTLVGDKTASCKGGGWTLTNDWSKKDQTREGATFTGIDIATIYKTAKQEGLTKEEVLEAMTAYYTGMYTAFKPES